jgi:Initiator Replication protein
MSKSPVKRIDEHKIAIKTPQSLIHIKHRISLLQYKYWILLLRELKEQFESGAPPDENGFRYVSMSIIEEALGYSPNKAEMLKDLTALIKEPITCNVLEKDGEQAKYIAGFLSEAKVTSNRVAFKLPSMLEGVVRGLEEPKAIFQLLNWSIFNHFSGKYEAVIYKLCKDYVGVERTPYITLQEFREYMGLKDGEYDDFRRLSTRVIKEPCERINSSEVSDITVRPDYEREGRKVIGLRFLVSRKAQATIPFPELESSPVFRFAKIHIEPATQQEYLSLRPPEEIELCIERANEYADDQKRAGKDTDLGAIYRRSITDGWHVSHLAKKKRKEAIVEEGRKKQNAAQEKEAQEAAQEKEARARINEILTRFDALSEEQKNKLRADYLSTLTASIVRKPFEKDGEKSAMHRVGFANFVIKESVSK